MEQGLFLSKIMYVNTWGSIIHKNDSFITKRFSLKNNYSFQ